MAELLDQPDTELDLFADGEPEAQFSERDVLGDDDEELAKDLEEDEHTSKNGDSDVKVVKSEACEPDLYDAAIEPSGQNAVKVEVSQKVNNSSTQSGQTAKSLPALGVSTNSSGRRYCCYIGNMTWWTTDIDLQQMIISCGASNLIDIKFYENRNNGQSKGFALAVFTSEGSVKTVMEKLPQKTLHGQQLVVLPYTKTSLAKFEDATRRIDQRAEKKEPKKEEQTKTPFVGTIRIGTQSQPTIQQNQMNVPPPMPLRQQVQVPPPLTSLRAPSQVPLIMQSNQQVTQIRGPPPNMQPLPLGAITVNRPPMNMSAPPPNMPQVQLTGGPQLNRPPPGFGQPPQAMSSMSSAGPTGPMAQHMTGAPPTSHPPPAFPPPGAHINPQVYRQNYGGHLPSSMPSTIDGMSEAEFEEIMNRNRTVSSSAITRAVSDAAANDYNSAIETLVTAISLIRQSRVSNDDRCKVLISSLQDTLNGIESKSYNSSRKHRSNRDRSRSPSDRPRKRHRRSSRSRSRSRERYEYSPRHSSGRRAY